MNRVSPSGEHLEEEGTRARRSSADNLASLEQRKKASLREGLTIGLLVWLVIPGAIMLVAIGVYFLVRGVL